MQKPFWSELTLSKIEPHLRSFSWIGWSSLCVRDVPISQCNLSISLRSGTNFFACLLRHKMATVFIHSNRCLLPPAPLPRRSLQTHIEMADRIFPFPSSLWTTTHQSQTTVCRCLRRSFKPREQGSPWHSPDGSGAAVPSVTSDRDCNTLQKRYEDHEKRNIKQ